MASATRLERALKAGGLDDRPKRLWAAGGIGLALGGLVWLAGWLLHRAAGWNDKAWNSLWALTGVSFANSVIVPIPGATATLLYSLSRDPLLGFLGCLGAALGSTAGAAVLLGLGQTGREALRKRATKGKWRRKALAWSEKAARKWTYAAVALLLVPNFIPKLVVLYAAVLAKLKAVPFLAAVFVGVFLRSLVALGAFAFLPDRP